MRFIVFRYFQFIAILLLGILIGAGLMSFIAGKKIDELHLSKDTLTSQIQDKNITIAELEKNLENLEGQKFTVKRVAIYVNLAKDDKVIKLKLEQKIKEMLLPIVGRELKDLDPLSIPAIINKRKVSIENDEYLLEVTNTLISEEIIMYVKVKDIQL